VAAEQVRRRENLEAIDFIKELNEVVHGENPGAVVIAEESTAWPAVSRPSTSAASASPTVEHGWMNDTLRTSARSRLSPYHHNNLTFAFLYAWSENFILPLSHDEVVHGKGSLLSKMPGDLWQKLATCARSTGTVGHPGKKLLFMGCEFAQEQEFSECVRSIWHPAEARAQRRLAARLDLNRIYQAEPRLGVR